MATVTDRKGNEIGVGDLVVCLSAHGEERGDLPGPPCPVVAIDDEHVFIKQTTGRGVRACTLTLAEFAGSSWVKA